MIVIQALHQGSVWSRLRGRHERRISEEVVRRHFGCPPTNGRQREVRKFFDWDGREYSLYLAKVWGTYRLRSTVPAEQWPRAFGVCCE